MKRKLGFLIVGLIIASLLISGCTKSPTGNAAASQTLPKPINANACNLDNTCEINNAQIGNAITQQLTINSATGTGQAFACFNEQGTIYRSQTPCVESAPAQSPYSAIKGDTNGNKIIETADADIINQYFIENISGMVNLCVLDTYVSGYVNGGDSLCVLMYVNASTNTNPNCHVGELCGLVKGDINGDGFATNEDAILVQQIFAGIAPMPEDICIADVNNSGSINGTDALCIQYYVANGFNSPSCYVGQSC